MILEKVQVFRLAIIVLFVVLGSGSVWAQDTTWDGTDWTTEAPKFAENKFADERLADADHDGKSWDKAFVITTARQLAYFAWIVKNNKTGRGSAYYWKLGADIDLNNKNWVFGGNSGNAFQGHFDGQNHTISNLKLDVTTNSNYGLFTTIQGASTTSFAEVKNLKISGVTFSSTTSRANNTRLGALTGYAKQANISNITVSNVTFTYSAASPVTNTNQLGGLIGCIENYTTISNSKVNTVTATLNGVNTATTATNDAYNLDVAGLVGYAKGDIVTIKGCKVSNVSITTSGRTNGTRLAGLIGYVETNGTGGKFTIKSDTVATVSITANGNTAGATYLGGLVAYVKGKASPDNRTLILGNTVTSPTVTMNGEVYHNFYQGGFIGYVDANTNVFNNNVTTPVIKITNNIVNNSNTGSYVGGAIGAQANYTTVDGMTVSGGSIIGPTETKTVINNRNFFVGGFIGQMNSSGTVAYQPDLFKNIAVTGININLEHYVPAGNISNNKFGVGGIAGCIHTPNKDVNGFCGMPENIIFKGGKIYAPYATTSPTVANFNVSNPQHNTLTTEIIATLDALDKAKTKTWYYSDYQLGLSPDLLSGTKDYDFTLTAKDQFRRNYTSSATITEENSIKYLTVNNSTFQKQNRYVDSERDSKTVLWWTTTAAVNATKAEQFTNEEQPIYPYNAGAAATTYPYYWYFFQGVMNANYVTDAVATKIIDGIAANKTQAANAAPITLIITNNKEDERGFAQRTISVAAKTIDAEGNVVDATTGITGYQWYVDGVAKSTGTSITLTPHWKDGQGIVVNALNGATIVATAAYTLAPGVMHTKESFADASAEKIRSDINARGTKKNPYIIDCENALRQWSYLSTAQTGTRWEDIAMPIDPMTSKASTLVYCHYNRAYYELGANITMSNDPFIPISHVGYGADGTYGTYSNNFIFQGNFNGNGKTIKNLHITWGAGQYNGNGTNIYYGLFGAVGHSAATAKWGDGNATSLTVIKNLVIDGAVLTHDVSNSTFSYKKDYTHITANNFNNCMVGVLAGIVNDNTTIQNIEIRGSQITDATTTSDYSLATQGLYVGGAIGSVQRDYKTTSTAITGIDIQHIAAQVDITLTHPAFAENVPAQLNLFNVGGIVGRYMATSATQAQMQGIMPKYTFYSGTVNAEKAWISPVIGATRFSGQNGGDFKHYSKQWEGNNADAASQLKVTNAQYYNFHIYYDGNSKEINETFPDITCKLGFRTLVAHSDGQTDAASTYTAAKYQGVNYNARYAELNSTLELLNKERTDGYSFVWDGSFVKMTTDTYVGLSLVREGETNKFNAVMEGGTPANYKWEVSFDETNWHEITGVTNDEYTVPVSLKSKYVRVSTTIDSKTYTTLIEVVDADKELCNPQITKTVNGDNTDFTFALNQKDTDPKAALTTTYKWYQTKATPISTATDNQPLTLSNTTLSSDTYRNVVFCKVTVTELGEQVAEYFLVNGATVVYINANGYTGKDDTGKDVGTGDDSNDGLTPQTPVLTLDKAYSLIKSEADGGTVDNNIIVIMGILNDDFKFQSNSEKPTTLTGKYGMDYHGVIKLDQINPSGGEHVVNPITDTAKGSNCYVLGDTQFENLIFYGNKKGNTFIELHGRDAIFGEGLVMQNFANLSKNHGNMNDAEVIPEFTIILYATNLSEERIKQYTNRIHNIRKKPQTVTFKSGHYGRLMGGRFTQEFFYGYTAKNNDNWKNNTAYSILGSAEYPVWAEVNVEISDDNEKTNGLTGSDKVTYSRDVNAIIAGLTDGSMYGDYTINFHGGNVAYIVGANQGNPVHNGKQAYTPLGGTNGSWGEWPNASYFGRTIINVDQKSGIADIRVGNLYAGGLGRMVQSGSSSAAVDMYVYGRTEVNVKNGVVSGSVYGGGVGGVIGVNPWDAHVPYATNAENSPENAAKAIQNGVQYGDTRYSPTWGTAMTTASPMAKVTLHNLNEAGDGYDIEELDLSSSSTNVNIMGGTVNGNVYGGGYGFVQDMPNDATMQGVGSVFGTTNIIITGDSKVVGNIYGGSQGHTEYYNKQNIYGQTINHVAEMNGTVNINIKGTEEKCPEINGDIYGAGQGISSVATGLATQEDVETGKAKEVGEQLYEEYIRIATTGNTDLDSGDKYKSNINITIDIPDTKVIKGNVFGGGRMGAVDGDINVTILGGQINGNVYGGGRGEKGHLQKARVNGTTNVKVGY